jgi:hypothetical protein
MLRSPREEEEGSAGACGDGARTRGETGAHDTEGQAGERASRVSRRSVHHPRTASGVARHRRFPTVPARCRPASRPALF